MTASLDAPLSSALAAQAGRLQEANMTAKMGNPVQQPFFAIPEDWKPGDNIKIPDPRDPTG